MTGQPTPKPKQASQILDIDCQRIAEVGFKLKRTQKLDTLSLQGNKHLVKQRHSTEVKAFKDFG
eukprot:939256-Amphidinium_carterae.1